MSERPDDIPEQADHTPEAVDQTLVEAVNAAGLLLDYAAERGSDPGEKFIDENVMETIVLSKHTLATRALNNDEESAFWIAYRKLCIATAPVSRDSLEATRARQAKTFLGRPTTTSDARKSVKYYELFTILFLLVLLLFQVYWVFLSTLVHDTQEVNNDLLVFETNDYKKNLSPQVQTIDENVAKMPAYRKDSNYDYRNDPEYKEKYRQWRANLQLLKKTDLLGWVFDVKKISENDPVAIHFDKGGNNGGAGERQQFLNSVLTKTGAISVNVMSLYFLPILYGLVGACAYILRTISQQIEARTFTRSSNIHFHLRMVLGALAGFSVAWFVGGDASETSVKHVAPLALAFLAGYSIELVFSAMDTIVEAFTRKRPSNQGEKVKV